MPSPERNSFWVEVARSAFVLIVLAALYSFYKSPIKNLVLSYYDDGETLYHTMSILMGKIPYLEDTNHHFMGYIAPFVWFGKLFGFSPSLTYQMAFINQIFSGLGVYLCLRFFVPWKLALLGGALVISQREPWVHAFYVQYQINLLLIFIVYFSLRFLNSNSISTLSIVGLLAGALATFDQRALHFVGVPWLLLVLFGRKAFTVKHVISAACSILAPISLALIYLWKNAAFEAFIQQTLIFPSKYRIGGKTLANLIADAVQLHKPLLFGTPLLLIFSFLGFIYLIKSILPKHAESSQRTPAIFLALLFPFFGIMPLMGSRDYEYYTITWLPYLSIIAMLSPLLLAKASTLTVRTYTALIAAPIVLACLGSSKALVENPFGEYRGDGVNEVVEFLNKNMAAEETLYVWGYRPDIYVRLKRLSAYPFATTIFFHPDQMITTNREKHIYPEYEQRFLSLLQSNPPTYVVVFNRSKVLESPSPSQQRLFEVLASDYREAFDISKKDHAGELCSFKVYKAN